MSRWTGVIDKTIAGFRTAFNGMVTMCAISDDSSAQALAVTHRNRILS